MERAAGARQVAKHLKLKLPKHGGVYRGARAKHQPDPSSERFTPVSKAVTKNGRTTVQYFSSPTFKNTRKGWVRLNGHVSKHSRGGSLYADGMALPTSFGRARTDLMEQRTARGTVKWKLRGARNSAPVVKSRKGHRLVMYVGVRRGVDLSYQLSGSRAKEVLLLKNASSAKRFTFDVKDPRHLLGRFVRGKGGSYAFDGPLGDGLTLSLSAPFATSLNGTHLSLPGDGSATQRVARTRSGYRVTLSLNKRWAARQQYPIVLDPTQVYSFAGGTVGTAYAPTSPTACAGDPCPLASEVDGSVFAAADTDEFGPISGFYKFDLSNIPIWTQIDSATFSLGLEVDQDACFSLAASTSFWDTYAAESGSDIVYDSDNVGGGLLFQPDEDSGVSVSGFPLYSGDATTVAQDWIFKANQQAALAVNFYYNCTRSSNSSAAKDAPVDGNYYGGGWLYDPTLTIEYTGPILPTPIPVEQSYGCDCAWAHGADLSRQDADPVNTALGNAIETRSDLSTPGLGVSLDVARTYNGMDETDGSLGAGWAFAYDAKLTENAATGDVTFRDPTGGQSVYSPSGSVTYQGAPGVTATLVAVSAGGWTLTSLAGEVMTFNAAGEMTSDVDARGNGMSLAYAGSGASRHLSVLTDDSGRNTTLTYGTSSAASGKLIEVATDDGREVHYAYTTVASAPHLTSVTAPDGLETTLSYDSASGRLDGETSPGSNTSAQNVYGPDGRITEQTDANGNVWRFDWAPAPGTQPDGSGTEKTTDPAGNITRDIYYGNVLLTHIDAAGNQIKYAYDENLNVVAITDANGYVTTMSYDGAGNMLTRTAPDPISTVETWTYDAANNVTSYTDGRGKTTTYTYNAANQPLTATDPLSQTTTMTYTAAGQLATVTTPEGRETTYAYDTDGNRTSQTSPEGNVTSWTYDPAGRVATHVDPRGNASGATATDFTTSYTYDDVGRQLTSTDPAGTITESSYDDNGNVAEQTVTDDASQMLADTAFTYDAMGNVLTTKDFTRTVETNTYDERNLLASSTDGTGAKTTYGYDQLGHASSEVSPRGNEPGANDYEYSTYYSYDAVGNLYGTYGPAAHDTTNSYDALNRRTGVYSSASGWESYDYDDAGRKIASRNAYNNEATWSYDDAGRMTSQTLPGQGAATYAYDDDGNRLSATSPSGDSQTTWTYDDDGRVVTQIDPRGNESGATAVDYTTTYGYDHAGNRTSITDQLGNTITTNYDARNNLVSRTDPTTSETTWSYDGLNRITSVNPPGTGSDSTTYSYDDYGNITERTNGRGKTTTYAYNERHQPTSVIDPLSREKTYVYDADGNLASWVTARGHASGATAADFTVDQSVAPTGEVIARTTSDSDSTASFGYDDGGRLTSVDDVTGSSYLGYDDVGRLTSVQQPAGDYSYTYNGDGQVTERVTPTQTLGYTYDEDGLQRSMSVGGQTVDFDYNPDQLLSQITYPTAVGVTESRTYDPAKRISTITADKSGVTDPIASYHYTRNKLGSPTKIERTRGTTVRTDAMTYDAHEWLTKYCPQATTCTGASDYIGYSYDKNGNRTQQVRAGSVATPGTTDYNYDDADELTSSTDGTTTTNNTYDADGELTSDGREWNALGQLTASGVNDSATYAYDGLGNRRTVTVGSDTTSQSWDINNDLPMLSVITAPDGDTSSQLYGPDESVLATLHPQATYDQDWFVHDALGSVVDSLDGSGTTMKDFTYDPFGGVSDYNLLASGAIESNFGFTGGYIEPASGNVALRARDYDTATGRFERVDPIGSRSDDDVYSPYGYVNNRPSVLTDPSGMCFLSKILCEAAASALNSTPLVSPIVNIVKASTNHIGGCADRDYGECGGLFLDLVSGGSIEGAANDLSGCSDRNGEACTRLWVDIFVAGEGCRFAKPDAGPALDKFWEIGDVGPPRVGSTVPTSFDLNVGGTKFFVNPNATKHLAELERSSSAHASLPPHSSLAGAIESMMKRGLKPGRNFSVVDGWEIGIDTYDNVIYHLLYRP